MPRPAFNAAVIALALAGCDARRADSGPVVVSAIGGALRLANPNAGGMDMPARLLLDATAQGLVRFDANGEVEPGLAERWIVIDDGRSYIFRLRDAEWSDGRPVTAGDVVAALSRVKAAGSRNPIAPFVEVIDEVVEMTPQVIEVRLKRPRPDLLKLLAQPEMAIFSTRTRTGSGPMRIAAIDGGRVTLRPAFDPRRSPDQEPDEPAAADTVQLHGERAAMAVARFILRQSDMVTGGTFDDWPIAAARPIAPANLRVDPAAGLFGLAVTGRTGFLADVQNRAAVAMAIDRAAITAAFRPDWTPVQALLPSQLDSAQPPALPAWSAQPVADRRQFARQRVAAWARANRGPVAIAIALPTGPGGTRLWGHVAAALVTIGLSPRRVRPGEPADLTLIDAVSPYDSGRWYLRTACRLCGAEANLALDAARDAPTLDARAQRIAEADRIITAEVAFIPLAQPLRWSIVALRLDAWSGNPRAWHPLTRLRKAR